MRRVMLSIAFASVVIAASFGTIGVLAFPVVLVGGLLFGIPLLELFKGRSWLNWWHALVAGAIATIPYIVFYLSINQGHTEHVGFYNSVYAFGAGMIGGLIVWLVGVFRNPAFMESNARFPRSIAWVVPILAGVYAYHEALEPIYVYGCIVDYRASSNPTSWHHSDISVVTDHGERFDANVSAGSSNPRILGNCVFGSKKRTAGLNRFYFTVHDVHATGCRNVCPNSAPADTGELASNLHSQICRQLTRAA